MSNSKIFWIGVLGGVASSAILVFGLPLLPDAVKTSKWGSVAVGVGVTGLGAVVAAKLIA